MRRINNINKVADLIKSNFKSNQVKIQPASDGSLDIFAPFLPSMVVSMVSSDIRIGVFPYTTIEVQINIYKL